MSDVRRATTPVKVVRVHGSGSGERPDDVVTEEPLEIRAAGPGEEPTNVVVTMRTPGHDFELAAGLLYTEGLIAGQHELATVQYCDPPDGQPQHFNVVTVCLKRAWDDRGRQRSFLATASCGVCGKASIDQVEVMCPPLADQEAVAGSLIQSLPDPAHLEWRGPRCENPWRAISAAALTSSRGITESASSHPICPTSQSVSNAY